jgi:hypothetical protein
MQTCEESVFHTTTNKEKMPMTGTKNFILTLLIGVIAVCGVAHAENCDTTASDSMPDSNITLVFGQLEHSPFKKHIFAQQGSAPADQGAKRVDSAAPSGGAGSETREVYINRVKLDDATVGALETKYRVPIQNGHYWYDTICGAWGVEGGPTAGFIYSGLKLPGPMPEDISRGGTGIFINGREIHPLDQVAFQKIFGYTIPGRYWLDAHGNLGPEGGAPIANLAAAIRASQSAQSGSVTHGYGKGYGSRGTLGGGMYSGRTASGKSVLWYPGM